MQYRQAITRTFLLNKLRENDANKIRQIFAKYLINKQVLPNLHFGFN